MPVSDLLQLAYSVFNNRDVAKEGEHAQRDKHRCKWRQWLCPLRNQHRGGQTLWADLAKLNHMGHGYPDKVSAPRVTEGTREERLGSMRPFQTARALAEGLFQMPVSDREPWPLRASQSKD